MIKDIVPGTDYIIFQDKNNFKYTTDSLILSSFCKGGNRLIDLGCGSGILSLRLIDRFDEVFSVDINEDVLELFKKSILENKLEDRITLIKEDIVNLKRYFDTNFFDKVIFNPPYFNSIAPIDNVSTARHSSLILKYIEIIKYLLKNSGELIIIFPVNRLAELIYNLELNNLKVKELIFLKKNINSASKLVILRCRKQANFGNNIREFYLYENSDELSSDMKRVYDNEVILWFIFVQLQLVT